MTLPVFLADANTLQPAPSQLKVGQPAQLRGEEARHAISVRRLRVGEQLDLVDGQGLRATCTVSAVAKDALSVKVQSLSHTPPPVLRLALVQALAKGGRDEQAVETCTEVGVDLIVPWQGERCVSVWKGPKADKGRQRWQATARQAAKQARRCHLPQVEPLHSTTQLADWVRASCTSGQVVVLLHEEATAPIASVQLPQSGQIAVIVGPEGGIGASETQALVDAGAQLVRLGPHVMRTASAGAVALAVLAQRAGLWG